MFRSVWEQFTIVLWCTIELQQGGWTQIRVKWQDATKTESKNWAWYNSTNENWNINKHKESSMISGARCIFEWHTKRGQTKIYTDAQSVYRVAPHLKQTEQRTSALN